ncbi:ribosome bioproteinsis GTPase A-like [Hibiscus syriacus]|uniref:Ribosome bioproteinsis GTPase A-like n=1 Tax=Hibiscus syriacus TaxID=106335 RepID=A0A6A2XZ33_HIBSY|nr:ribosome bioproteinsis GTPase A-like [Hibiscus syriacus]
MDRLTKSAHFIPVQVVHWFGNKIDDTHPILDWICSSLRPSNVLSLSVLSLYEQIVQEGKLLEGKELDFAYDSISAFSSRRDNQEAIFRAEEGLKDIRDATAAYKAEALELQKHLRHLQSQFDMLTGQAIAFIHGRHARVTATSTTNGHLKTIDDIFSGRNLQMNEVLGKIASTAQELAHYHSGDEEGIYLAYSDFHPYLVGDSSCIMELNKLFAKQLDTIYDSPLEYLNISSLSPKKDDQTNILIHGVLQLPANSNLMVDETQLESGSLSSIGIENTNLLKNLIEF